MYYVASKLFGHDRRTTSTTGDRVRLSRIQKPIPKHPLPPFCSVCPSSTCSWKQRFRSLLFVRAKQETVSERGTLSKPYLVKTPVSGRYSLPAKGGVREQKGLRNAELSEWYRLKNVKLHLDRLKLRALQPQIHWVWKAHSQWPKRPERKTMSSLVRFLLSSF